MINLRSKAFERCPLRDKSPQFLSKSLSFKESANCLRLPLHMTQTETLFSMILFNFFIKAIFILISLVKLLNPMADFKGIYKDLETEKIGIIENG